MEDEYLSLASQVESEYKDRGSRFIAIAFPCSSAEEFRSTLEQMKVQYPAATHYCYAYRFGPKGHVNRANDDGEPGGTAGLPILNQMLSSEVSDAAVVVVRYYGGTKLGASGLIKAYKTAAAEALRKAEKKTIFPSVALTVRFPYRHTKVVEMLLKKHMVELISQDFSEHCTFKLKIRSAELSDFRASITTFEGITLLPT
jgi:uncharacterized YigZ family protein